MGAAGTTSASSTEKMVLLSVSWSAMLTSTQCLPGQRHLRFASGGRRQCRDTRQQALVVQWKQHASLHIISILGVIVRPLNRSALWPTAPFQHRGPDVQQSSVVSRWQSGNFVYQ